MTWGNTGGWRLSNTLVMIGNIINAGISSKKEPAVGLTKEPRPLCVNSGSWRSRKRNRGYELLKRN